MTTPTITDAQLRDLPKVELHVHLEGTMSADRIAELARSVGVTLPRPVDELFTFEGFDEFLDFLTWTCDLIRTPEVAAAVAYEHARFAAANGIMYSEVIVNPTHWRGWSTGDLVAGISEGFDRARDEGLTDCRLLLSILRQQSAEEAGALVDWMVAHPSDAVLGLSVDGNEAAAGRVTERFSAAYRRAADAGFGLTAHTGESSGPEGVRDVLDLLGVDRIDHGVRAIEDPELVARLAEERITLNICLSSNLLHLYPDLASHPWAALHRAGVPTTINTDDPGFVRTDLVTEFSQAARQWGWDLDDAAAVTRRAIEASFCDDTTKAALTSRLDAHLAGLRADDRADRENG